MNQCLNTLYFFVVLHFRFCVPVLSSFIFSYPAERHVSGLDLVISLFWTIGSLAYVILL